MTTKRSFSIGPGVTCTLERLVSTRLLVQANSGGGKSWALRRLLEQTHGAIQQIVIDPEGEFASLREKFDYVLAARQGGDTLADPRTAKLLAERLLELGVSAILDIYELQPRERVHFVRVFLETIVDAPKKLWHPALLLLDEAHVFCPEKGHGEAESADAVNGLMTRGRKRGFCALLATQRLSKLHKDAAAECNNKLIGRCTLDVDMKRAAYELGFTTKDEQLQLRDLEDGEFFAFGPALTKSVTRVKVGAVQTTHPKAGSHLAAVVPPPTDKVKALLPKLSDLPAEAEARERTIADFKKEIAALKRQVTEARKAAPSVLPPRPETKRDHERSARIADLKQRVAQQQRALEEAMKILVKVKAVDFSARGGEALEQAVTAAVKQITAGIEKRVVGLAERVQGIQASAAAAETAIAKLLNEQIDLTVTVQKQAPFQVSHATKAHALRSSGIAADASGLTPAKQKILNGLAFLHGIGVAQADKTQLALIVGVSPTSGGYFNNLGSVRTMGLIEYPSGGTVALTREGQSLARTDGVPSTTDELHAAIRAKLPAAKWKILEALIRTYPRPIAKDDLAAAIEVSPTSGGYFNNLGSLRSLGLVDYPQPGTVVAQPVLFLEA